MGIAEHVSSPRALTRNDDRGAFDCGRPALNEWFRRHAWANHAEGASRVNVIEHVESQRIVGFVALCACQIERAHLPKARQRNQPDPVPVTLLGQLAVDLDWQGRGCAGGLVKFALRMAVKASESVGSFAVITHPLDDGLRLYYARFGFRDLPFDPRRAMFLRLNDIAQSLRDAEIAGRP